MTLISSTWQNAPPSSRYFNFGVYDFSYFHGIFYSIFSDCLFNQLYCVSFCYIFLCSHYIFFNIKIILYLSLIFLFLSQILSCFQLYIICIKLCTIYCILLSRYTFTFISSCNIVISCVISPYAWREAWSQGEIKFPPFFPPPHRKGQKVWIDSCFPFTFILGPS